MRMMLLLFFMLMLVTFGTTDGAIVDTSVHFFIPALHTEPIIMKQEAPTTHSNNISPLCNYLLIVVTCRKFWCQEWHHR